jgi:hypothetical protein
MTDAITLAASIEQCLAAQTEWRVGNAQSRTYWRKFSTQADAQQSAGKQQQGEVYAHRQRLAAADLLAQAAELLRAQHAMLHRRSAAARRITKDTLTVSPAELAKIRAQLAALQQKVGAL